MAHPGHPEKFLTGSGITNERAWAPVLRAYPPVSVGYSDKVIDLRNAGCTFGSYEFRRV